MEDNKRIVAVAELLLICPAALFLTAVLARNLEPLQYVAQEIVTWYSGRHWTLWLLLIGLPMTALLTGGATLLWTSSNGSKQLLAVLQSSAVTRTIAASTLAAGFMLIIVGLHMLAN